MNLFERAAARFLERRNWLVSQDPPEDFGTLFGGADTSSGVQVTEQGALQMTAVFACVRILAETVASLPLILYERLPDGGKARATEYPLYSLLHDAPLTTASACRSRQRTGFFMLTNDPSGSGRRKAAAPAYACGDEWNRFFCKTPVS